MPERRLRSQLPTDAYTDLIFPDSPTNRPYALINMVTTIDGKILSGKRDEDVLDLGSKTDHLLMGRIMTQCDALMIGAQTLRASPKSWKPQAPVRIVVTRSGDLPLDGRFFEDAEKKIIAAPESAARTIPGFRWIPFKGESVDLRALLELLRNQLDIKRLLILGGSELNAQLIKANLIDELFVTIAPKVKLGRDVPTYADGEPLAREEMLDYKLLEHHAIDNEIFLRYRRKDA